MNMTEGELIAEIEAAWAAHREANDDSGALTRRELEERTGIPRGRLHEMIRAKVQAGEWEVVMVPRQLISGPVRRAPAYRPVKR